MNRAKQTDELRRKKERLEVFTCDLAQNRIYFDDPACSGAREQVPDRVKNYPLPAQRAFVVSFNNNLRRWGDVNFAFKAAWKTLENMVAYLKTQKKTTGNNTLSMGAVS